MEFNFEDDFFEDGGKEKNKTADCVDYIPKQCYNKWFVGEGVKDPSKIEDCNVLKYQADLLYYNKRYKEALKKYQERTTFLPGVKNETMLREINESIIRCLMKLNLFVKAMKVLDNLLHLCSNNLDSGIYKLAYEVLQANNDLSGALCHLGKAIKLNPQYPDYHFMLFETYKELLGQGVKAVTMDDGEEVVISKDLLCSILIKTRNLITDSVRGREANMSLKCKRVRNRVEDQLLLLKEA